MAINKIVKLNLETRAVKLRENGKSFDDIARTLSEDSHQDISKSNVFRFFDAYERSKAQIIERQEPLKVKYVEADISTIEFRLKSIKNLFEYADSTDDVHEKTFAMKTVNEALDSLDKRLGKLNSNSGITINNINAAKFEDVPLTPEIVDARHAYLKAVADARID